MKGFPGLIGVIHLPALAGAPASHGEDPSESLRKAGLLAVKEAKALVQAGFGGVILENFGDIPFYKSSVPPETIASLAVIAGAVRDEIKVPLGINVLRNDARSALAIASVTGCDFIRVNVLSGVAASDQGLIEGDAAYLLRERSRLHAHVAILADVHVKHAQSLSSDSLELGVEEVVLRSFADGAIISGSTTGRPVDISALEQASRVTRAYQVPLYVGSGATAENIGELKRFADGIIVSSSLRRGGKAGMPLDPARIKALVRAFTQTQARKKTRSARK